MTVAARDSRRDASAGVAPVQSVDFDFDWISSLDDADLAGMVAIFDSVALTTETNGFAEPLNSAQIAALAEKIRFGLRSGSLHQLIVRTRGQRDVIGVVTLECCAQPTRRHIVEVHRAAVREGKRGLFLRQAFAEVLRKCLSMGWEVLQIDVSEDGPVALWKRFGFRVFGVVNDYARVGERKLDGYYMTLNVADAVHKVGRSPEAKM